MKSIIPALLLFAFAHQLVAQIGVGPIEQVKLKPGKFQQEDIDRLKATETIFVCRNDDNVEQLQDVFREVWTITDLKVVPFSALDSVDFTGKSVFSIAGLNKHMTYYREGRFGPYPSMEGDITHVYLQLWMMGEGKKRKPEKKSFCRIELHPRYIDYVKITSGNEDERVTYLYTEADLKNWKTGFLKNYLKVVNDLLEKSEERWLYENEKNNPELRNLARDTLFVVDYALVRFKAFTGDESQRLDESEVFSKYPYPYKLLSTDVLNQKILASRKPFYYMVYVKSSTDKYVYVFNSKTGQVVYSYYKGPSYNLKDSDLKELARSINKSTRL